MTQTEFFMACKNSMKDVPIQQTDNGECVVKLSDVVSLKFESVPESLNMTVVLHVRERSYLLKDSNDIRQIAQLYKESKEKKTDLALRLSSFCKNRYPRVHRLVTG